MTVKKSGRDEKTKKCDTTNLFENQYIPKTTKLQTSSFRRTREDNTLHSV